MSFRNILSVIFLTAGIVLTGLWWRRTSSNPPTVPPVPCNIGYQEIALYRHVFVAQAKGFFKEEGIEAKLIPLNSGNNIMQALISGSIDVAGLTNLEVALSVESKDPGNYKFVNMLVWGDRSFPDFILVRTGSGISQLKELEGKTIGLHPGSAVAAFSRTVLESKGVDISKCNFLELAPNTMQAAVAAGRIDALYCMDPVATSLLQANQCTVLLTNPLGTLVSKPIPISGTALSRKFLQQHPDAAEKVIRALDKAILYLRSPGHEQEVADIIGQYTPITAKLAMQMNPSEYWTHNEVNVAQVQSLAARFVELKINDKPVDVKNIIMPPGSDSRNDAANR